jgi:hypothetical protein
MKPKRELQMEPDFGGLDPEERFHKNMMLASLFLGL